MTHRNSSNRVVNATKIKVECNSVIFIRAIRIHLGNIGIRYGNIQRKIFLTKARKERRVTLEKFWITSNDDGNKPYLVTKNYSLIIVYYCLTYVYKGTYIAR